MPAFVVPELPPSEPGPPARIVAFPIGLAGIAACLLAATPALAERWEITPSVRVEGTYTSNVDLAPSGDEEADFVTSVGAFLRFNGDGARAKIRGSLGVTGYFYTGDRGEDRLAPTANVFGWLNLVENFAYVEATANVSQTFISPFGAQPPDPVNFSNNTYTQQTYSVSPYIKGNFGPQVTYLLRNDNIWTVASTFGSTNGGAIPTTYSNHLFGYVNREPQPLGWRLEYDRFYYDNGVANGNGNYTTELVRAIVPWQIDYQTQVSARVGYENNEFPFSTQRGVIYGAGAQWRPTPRTRLAGFWEERFFGSSYQVNFAHRLPNVAIGANASRGINSYPQLSLAIPAGASVAEFVSAAFLTRIPDDIDRASAVEQFLAQTGLPPVLTSPVNFYAASLLLQDNLNATAVVIGVRQSLSMTVFWVKSRDITGTGDLIPPVLNVGQNNTQTGAGLAYVYRVTPLVSATAAAQISRTEANEPLDNGVTPTTRNASLRAALTARFTPQTSGSLSASYSRFTPEGDSPGFGSSVFNLTVALVHVF